MMVMTSLNMGGMLQRIISIHSNTGHLSSEVLELLLGQIYYLQVWKKDTMFVILRSRDVGVGDRVAVLFMVEPDIHSDLALFCHMSL